MSRVDSFKLGKAVMISFAVGNPIDQYNCRFNNLGDDAKCACLSRIRCRLPTWDDEITDSKGLFLDSHWGLCPVDKKSGAENLALIALLDRFKIIHCNLAA